MIQGRDIVCFSTADWDTALPTNKHQIMTRLARRNRVLFIETLGTRRVQWGGASDWGRIGRRLRRLASGVRPITPEYWPVGREPRQRQAGTACDGESLPDSSPAPPLPTSLPPPRPDTSDFRPGLWVLSPMVWPRWEQAIIAAMNRVLLRRQLRRALWHLGWERPIAWCYSPHAVGVLDALAPERVVYHMVDDLTAVPGAESEALARAEETLLRRADHVFCTEAELFRRAEAMHPGAVLMENVADFDHFHCGSPEEVSEAARGALEKVHAMPSPRLVFSGHLAPHKVDFELLAAIKQRHPEWSLVLIGPVWEGADPPEALRRLREIPGVLLTGRIAYQDLPPFLHAADALLIPYAINAVTRHVSPLKFFEYLATGKPIVSTPLPSILPHAELAEPASTPEEFARCIERALADPTAGRDRRLALARRNTWDHRIEEMSHAIER